MRKKEALESLIAELSEVSSSDLTLELLAKEKKKGYITLTYLPHIDFEIPPVITKRARIGEVSLFEVSKALVEGKIAVLDLETSGLSRFNQIFMAGLLVQERDNLLIKQFCAFTPSREKTLIRWLSKELKNRILVTFNGKTFDIPFLRMRAEINNMEFNPPQIHIDLLPLARKLFRDILNSKKLKVIEFNILDVWREKDINSALIPSLVYEFRRKRDERILDIVSRHNGYDLISTLKLLERILKTALIHEES